MSDSDSSDDEGIPSLSALVQSLVPNAPSSDSDDDDESDLEVGKLPSSISHLVQNLVSQYDSISDDDNDSGNSSSDDDDKKKVIKQATPATTDDDDSDYEDGDAGLSSLVQNILKQTAHRDSVEINSRLNPITKNIPRKEPLEELKEEKKTAPKSVEPVTAHTLISMASTLDGSHQLHLSSDDSHGLGNTVHSVPENEAVTTPLGPSTSDSPEVTTPLRRPRRRSKRNSQNDKRSSLLLNETSHTRLSAASTNSAFDPAELERTLRDDQSSSIANESVSSIDEFHSVGTGLSSRPKRKKSSSTTASKKSTASSKTSSKRKGSSSRRKFDKEPLSPLLGKMVGESTQTDDMDDILSPLPLHEPQKTKKKKKSSDDMMKNDSERSGSRSKRSRSSMSRSSHKSSKSKTKGKKEKDLSVRSVSRRSLDSIPETPIPKNKESSGRSKSKRSLKNEIPETPKSKKKGSSKRSLSNEIPETPKSKKRSSRAKRKSQQSLQSSIPETPISERDNTMRSRQTSLASPPPFNASRRKRSVDDSMLFSGRENRTIQDPSTIPETPGASTTQSFGKRDESQSKTPSTKQKSRTAGDPPDDAFSSAAESDKLSMMRADEEDVEHERPLHPVGPIRMISFATMGLLLPDEDTSISSSSTEEEDEYETESSEGDNEATEYGTDVSGSQIPASLAPEDSVANLPSEAGYETDPADANEDIENDYEDYESDKGPSESSFYDDNGGDEYESDHSESFIDDDFVPEEPPKRGGRRSMLQRSTKLADLSSDDYESDSSDSFVEDNEAPQQQTERRTMLERSMKQTDLSLDEYESDSSDSFVLENEQSLPKTGRRAMLERSVSSQDLSAVLDEYDLDSDSDEEDPVEESAKQSGRRAMLERSVSSQDLSAVLDEYDLDSDSEESAKQSGRRAMLERSVSSQDLSAVLDEYDLDSDSDSAPAEPRGESARQNGRRAMLERSVSSQDLSAVLDEYDLDSDSDSGKGEEYVASDSESDEDYVPEKKQRKRVVPETKQKKVRESWPAPRSNPRKNLPLSDASSSVDYTDSEQENDQQSYEFGSDDEEPEEPTQRSNGFDLVDEDGNRSRFDSDEDFEFDDDYQVIVSSGDESSDKDGEYSGGSGEGSNTNSFEEDRNYYAKLDAVTRREDRLALRSQRLRRKIYFAGGTMFVMIIGLVVLFIVDPLQKDVLSDGNRRLRGRATLE